ncbi:hypothetical protein [uncultured Polaribacter sp.]|uniref:hypothetical protein n=1 Tax=uncultured Polaribacter sp. TaxID=174711 RepID=UPI00260E8EE6|nr:hypothetical protein [uncultured Polaribacter sp.]
MLLQIFQEETSVALATAFETQFTVVAISLAVFVFVVLKIAKHLSRVNLRG